MKDLDSLIENTFSSKRKKDTGFNFQDLLNIVSEVMDSGLAKSVLSERTMATTQKTMSVEMSFIPEINVSELGWSDVSTTESGEVIKGPQRQLLEDYLKNISGNTLSEKIASLEAFYENGDRNLVADAENRSEVIKDVMSYLVFYKTLTNVITNFNASSAGFSFESFLATLLDGKQIPASGAGTIADFTTGDNIPISLKLYAEKSLQVGGSYVDLVNDLVEPKFNHPGMRYVVCTKNLQGKGLEQNGSIKFYQFDIDINNVANIIGISSDKSAKCIRLPRAIETADTDYDINATLPSARNMPSIEDLKKIYEDNVRKNLKAIKSTISEDNLKIILDKIGWGTNEEVFKPADPKRFGGVEQGVVFGISKTDRPSLSALIMPDKQAVADMKAATGIANKNSIVSVFSKANDDLVSQFTRTKLSGERGKQLAAMAKSGEFLSPEDSVKLYNTLSEDMKKVALKNSLGYLETYQWHLNRTQATNTSAPLNAEYQGEIQVGTQAVMKLLNDVRDLLNQQVFQIFSSLKSLSDNLNSYFAGGLSDDRRATDAIDDAQQIEANTIEIKDQK
jgi:hypothetical protein